MDDKVQRFALKQRPREVTSMRRTIVLSVVPIMLVGSAGRLAQAQPTPPAPPAVISFFVAANPNQTGNLGGLAGADQLCQTQAQALGGQNAARAWRAYP